jgi:hypothetical protein
MTVRSPGYLANAIPSSYNAVPLSNAMRNTLADVSAGVITILCVHQPLILLLQRAGLVTWQAFNGDRVAPFGIPALLSACLWGAVWTLFLSRATRGLTGTPRYLRAATLGGVLTTVIGALLIALGRGTPMTGMSPAVAAVCSLCVNGVWSGAASRTAARFSSRK